MVAVGEKAHPESFRRVGAWIHPSRYSLTRKCYDNAPKSLSAHFSRSCPTWVVFVCSGGSKIGVSLFADIIAVLVHTNMSDHFIYRVAAPRSPSTRGQPSFMRICRAASEGCLSAGGTAGFLQAKYGGKAPAVLSGVRSATRPWCLG